jgi:glycosyltransferase involved in cell wall biosynthesis
VKIAIVTSCLPFQPGPAEKLAEELRKQLAQARHKPIVASIPFTPRAASRVIDQIVACRSLRLPNTDLMIGLNFPAYYIPHANKVMWLVDRLGQAYESWGRAVQQTVIRADGLYLREAGKIYSDSEATRDWLWKANGIQSEVLCPPLARSPHLRWGTWGDYVLYASSISESNRQMLLVEAARHLRSKARVVLAGQPETPEDLASLRRAVTASGLEGRITIFPQILTEEQRADLLADALACVSIPANASVDPHAVLEACHCRKATITCVDSVASCLAVIDRSTGRCVYPDPVSLAEAIDELHTNRELASQWGASAFHQMLRLGIDWDNVVQKLTS